ncbi:unnamed protein product, partial [Sphacelaria rigidula]
MIDLTPQEMEELGISDLDAVLVDVHHSDWVAMNAARAKMKEICRVHPTGAIARRPTFYEVVKETLETFRSSGVVKATGSTWRKPPVAIPSSLYGRRSSVGSRSRKGWHGGARQDKTATSPTRTAPSYRNNGGDTVAAASVVDAVDDEEEDGDVDDEEEDQHWDAAASLGVDVDDDVKLDCAVSLPADQMTALELGHAGLGKSSVTVRDKSR